MVKHKPDLVILTETRITSEKLGGKSPSLSKCLTFQSSIHNCNLYDIGFQGSNYTWSNKNTLIKERLDRFLCNVLWHNLFPDSKVYHLFSGALIITPCPPYKSS